MNNKRLYIDAFYDLVSDRVSYKPRVQSLVRVYYNRIGDRKVVLTFFVTNIDRVTRGPSKISQSPKVTGPKVIASKSHR